MSCPGSLQRIARLTPLSQVRAAIAGLAVLTTPIRMVPAFAVGRVLADDIAAPASLPGTDTAIRDGWAVAASQVADAGPYAPAPLAPAPPWVDAGDAMPAGTDAVLPPNGVTVAGDNWEAVASASPGDGVMPAGGDVQPSNALCRAGTRLLMTGAAAMAAAGIIEAAVRVPSIRVVSHHPEHLDTVAPFLLQAISAAGGDATVVRAERAALKQVLVDDRCDAIVVIGGTGEGRGDTTIRTLGGCGTVHIHGMGIRPGETAALGTVASRPVLALPGRLDAALAAWLLVGRELLDRLAGATEVAHTPAITIARKIVSTVGIAEMVLIRRGRNGLEPVAGPVFPLDALAQAEGWVLVPAESEGYQAGATVELRPLP